MNTMEQAVVHGVVQRVVRALARAGARWGHAGLGVTVAIAGACNDDGVTQVTTGIMTIGVDTDDDGRPMADSTPGTFTTWGGETTWGDDPWAEDTWDGGTTGSLESTTTPGTTGPSATTFETTTFETTTFETTTFETTTFETTTFETTTFETTTFGETTTGGTSGGVCPELDLGSAVGPEVATGTTVGAGDDLPQNCAGGDGPDVVLQWTPPNPGTWTFDTAGSDYDTALTAFTSCDAGAAFACDDDGGPNLTSELVLELDTADPILIVVEGYAGATGDYILNIDGEVIDPGTTDTTTDGTTDDTTDGTTTGDPLEAFESPQPFGDSVLETDLIGVWNLPTDGGPVGYSMTLTVNMDGTFVWRESDAACVVVREGTGTLWVVSSQLVMLFETFDGLAPWPVFEQLGFDAEAPFLIRAGYAPVNGHIAITAPPDMRVTVPWASRGYARTVGGTTGLDVWVSETELWDVPDGETTATIIARDRHTLDVVAGPNATYTFQRWWYDGGVQSADPPAQSVLPYTDDLVGHLVLDGSPYVYLGARMASFATGHNFLLNGPSSCP